MQRIYIKQITEKSNQEVELAGWVDSRRDHGKLIFIDLRDKTGKVQVVIKPDAKEAYKIAQDIRDEWVVSIKGVVKERPENMKNADIETGGFEIPATELKVLNSSKTPPFPLNTDGYDLSEEVRLKYRYLDLRRERLNENIKLRSELIKKVREFLFEKDFTEIETPLLTKATPEGARDFLVPARLHPGKFFALPQSPQQYKQLLMVAGFEKYFQIARAVRDEDLRADRGFEHTQIDIEMSFVKRDEVMALNEKMITSVFESLGRKIKQKPFPILTYAEAMEKYGEDRFDMRNDKEKEDGVLAFAWVVDFPFFEKTDEGNWTFTHNPFSQPKEEFIEDVLAGKNTQNILTTQYDLVCNGYEVGGGSIRAHKPEVLKAVLKVIGYSEKEAGRKFGHMIEALNYGAPPHGGIAYGVERLIMILQNEQYLREVQAFPQTGSGKTSVMEAPSEVDAKQLRELGIKVIEKKDEDKK
ncbi:MAG: aspartate--tRNA ligase [Candidatus Spechtbacterales bacterium]|nr:aspartate--tRNA ligase [Candidatus Spechtbacterales bacterium]